jgi:hypothetical protein
VKTSGEHNNWDAGSRMHLLDWLASPQFLPQLREFVAPLGFSIRDDAHRRPKGRSDHTESELVGSRDPFLTVSQKNELRNWWLVHKTGAKLPNWDLAVAALDESTRPALILVEAKAHRMELSASGKARPSRDTPEQQARSDANHGRIAEAIAKANVALRHAIPEISLSRDVNYQFANRIAFAWKLASLGIPVALIYLGFIGDRAIAQEGFYLATSDDWRDAFGHHTAAHFPASMQGRRIECGAASFWLLLRDLRVQQLSPPIEQRRLLD